MYNKTHNFNLKNSNNAELQLINFPSKSFQGNQFVNYLAKAKFEVDGHA